MLSKHAKATKASLLSAASGHGANTNHHAVIVGAGQYGVNPGTTGSGVAAERYKPAEHELGEGLGPTPVLVSVPEKAARVEASEGIGLSQGCTRESHLLTWILTIAIWIMLLSLVICNSGDMDSGYCVFFSESAGAALGVTAAIAIAYWIECFCAGTGKYLSNVLEKEGAAHFVERVKGEPAEIHWTAQCYHYKRKVNVHHHTDANGHRQTQATEQEEKVFTWRAAEQYRYRTCIDVSGELLGLNEYKLTKLRLRKTFGFADVPTQNDYLLKRNTFRMLNWQDRHQDFTEEMKIPGYVGHVLAESEPGVRPGWMTLPVYWLSNVLFFSPCFRHKMTASCGNAEYTFVKQLSCT